MVVLISETMILKYHLCNELLVAVEIAIIANQAPTFSVSRHCTRKIMVFLNAIVGVTTPIYLEMTSLP